MEFRNGCMMRKDKSKPGPSEMSQNQAYSLPEAWNGRNCLLKIEDLSIIKELKDKLGGDELVSFLTPEFSVHALEAFNSVDVVISLLKMYGLYLWKCYHYCTISYNPIYSHPSKILASYSRTRLEFTYQFEEGYLFGIPQLVWHCHNGYESDPIASLVRHD